MSKKIIATIVVLLMTLSIFGAMHVPVAKAQGNDLAVFLRPGAPDPNNPGFSHTLGTLRDNPELVIDQYLEYAVLASSTGDFEFIVNTYTTLGYIEITYPCEFTFTQTSIKYSVWTDITNDYGYIDNDADDCTVTIGSHVDLGENLVIYPGTYMIRLFAMKAPEAFGLYYFQIATDLEPDGINPLNWPIVIVKGELNPGYVTGIVDADTGLTDGVVTISGTTPEGRAVTGTFPLTPGTDDYGYAMFEDDATGNYVYWLFGVPAGSYEVTACSIDDGYACSTSARFSVSAAQSTHLPDLEISAGPAVMITVWSKHGRGTIPWGCLWQPPYGTNNPYSTECDESQYRDITLAIYDEAGAEVTSDTWSLDPTAVSFSQTLTILESGKTYSIKAFVTGYVMVDEDAGQRTFSVAGDMSVEMDLRRSNWFEITAHTFEPNNPMTVVYEAYNEAGELKGHTAYVIPAGGFPEDGPSFVVLEGFNHEGDEAGGDTYRDYGLEPGTYQIKMYAADGGPADPIVPGAVEGTGWYYIPADEPTTASIALCNSPSTLSFAVESITMTIILRSVDWEAPAHVRQWTFPGAEIWVNFLNADTNEVAASLDPTVWGLVQDCTDADGNPLIMGSNSWDPYLVLGDDQNRLQIKWTGDNVDVYDALTVDLTAEDYPTHIAPGQYQFEVNTLGYVTRRVFPVWVPAGGNGDIQADLIQGGEISVDVSFTKEGQDVDFYGYVRVEAYNANGELVGANIYHQAVPNYVTSVAGGGSYANYDPEKDWKGIASGQVPCAAEASNIDDADGDECLDGQRGYTSSLLYGVPAYTWDGWPFMEVQGIAANGLYPLPAGESERYDLFGFYWYYGAASSRNTGLWANGWDTTDGVKQNDHGLPGTRDITGATGAGLYTVKVYAFGWTPDGQYVSYYADPVENIDVQWGGYTAVSVSMAEMGRVTGTITWIDAFGNMRNMPWAMLGAGETASHSTSPLLADWGLWDNDAWVMWLPAGTHDFSVSADGASQTFAPAGSTIVVSDGFSASYDQTLYPTGVPVPEFPATTALALLSALSASIFLLRRKRIAKK